MAEATAVGAAVAGAAVAGAAVAEAAGAIGEAWSAGLESEEEVVGEAEEVVGVEESPSLVVPTPFTTTTTSESIDVTGDAPRGKMYFDIFQSKT